MTVTREFTIWCDGLPGDAVMSCGNFVQSGGTEDLTDLKAKLSRWGWAIKPKYARCPGCIAELEEQK